MKKITIALLFWFFCANLVKSQIIKFEFDTEPYLEITNSNLNISVSDLALSSGTIRTNVTTGTYFINEPYVEESGGWAVITESEAKYFYIDITAHEGYRFTISNIAFEAYVTASGPSAISALLDNGILFSSNMPDGSLQTISQAVTEYTELTQITLKIAGWDNGSRTTTGGGAFRIDNLVIDGLVELIPENDSSSIINNTQFPIPLEISSLINAPFSVPVMEFNITDSATGDGVNTFIDSLIFQIDTNYYSTDWALVLDEVKLVSTAFVDTIEGIVNNNTIVFNTDGLFEIHEGVSLSDTCQLLISLQSNLPDVDTWHLNFIFDSVCVYCNPLGSKVGWGSFESGSNNLMIQVDATELDVEIDTLPVWKDSIFNILVKSVDVNGNIDRDEIDEVRMQLEYGDGILQSENLMIANFIDGEYVFKDLVFSGSDTVAINILSSNYDSFLISSLLISKPLFYDNFESNSLAQWSNIGDWDVLSQHSINENYSLKHNVSGVGGISCVSSEYRGVDMNSGKMIWRLVLKNGDFDPSLSNRFWYYIMASENNLISDTTYGYVVGVNFLGSSDTLSLWKIDSIGNKALILQTDFDWDENNTVSIEVVRESWGTWQMGYAENNHFNNLYYTNKADDNSFVNLPYHGLVYQYSSTRAGLLWCDNIYAGMINSPPILINAEGISNSIIQLNFSESLNKTASQNMINYEINSKYDSLIAINKVIFDTLFSDRVLVEVNRLKTAGYTIRASNLSDIEGCTMQSNSLDFNHTVAAEQFDIVFNEVMFDPYPIVDLPDADYLEIYNRSSNPINLEGWQLDIGGVIKTFPDSIIDVCEYLIITSSAQAENFIDFGKTVGIISSTALTNTGKVLKLMTNDGLIIDSLSYNPDWITDGKKQDGGWSLERIDFDNSCGTFTNWQASGDVLGGTPGVANSVFRQNIDNISPQIINSKINSRQSIILEFSEPLDLLSMFNTDNYIINSQQVSVDSVVVLGDYPFRIIIWLKEIMQSGESNYVRVKSIIDMCGNVINDTIINIKINSINFNDIIISEIMVDPSPANGLPEYEYIELYNRSIEPIDITDWLIVVNGNAKNLSKNTILPDSFLVILSNSAFDEYYFIDNKMSLTSFASLSNKSGIIELIDTVGLVVNRIDYEKDWYHNNEKDNGGWSLEVIDPENFCGGVNNWQVSENILGGTPGSVNSVNANNIDINLPSIISIIPINSKTILVRFSESVKNTLRLDNFILNGMNPVEVCIDSLDATMVVCNFSNEFVQKENYGFSVFSISDFCDNILSDTIVNFTYYKPQLYDVVFNEIMSDPLPSVGLPEVEYLEIYNRTEYELQFYEWSIKVNNSLRELPYFTISSNSYLIICDSEDVLQFNAQLNVQGVDNFPGLPLSGSIALINQDEKLICKTDYESIWIIDDFKADGGFSLERIDYNNPHESSFNWQASNSKKGGTPGFVNSIYENISDDVPPDLLRAFPINDSVIGLQFSEPINISTLFNEMFEIDDDKIFVKSVSVKDFNLSIVYLQLNSSLSSGVEYTIDVNNTLTDIVGNYLLNQSTKIMLPVMASPFDIVINEVLFNPFEGSVDFIEFYNRSPFTVNLKQFILASFDDKGNIKNPKPIVDKGALLFPSGYVVVSENKESIKQQYWIEDDFAFIDIESLPTFSNSDGSVVIMDTNGVIIDYMYYSDDMHFGLLSDYEGVSLERVNYNRPSSERSNWHSAAEQIGWATPGYKNSMFNETGGAEGVITVKPEAFSPDSDGFDDVLYINYKFSESGNVAKVIIFDRKGREVITLVDNELMAIEGTLSWDGLNNSNQKAHVGIYVIYFEVFDLKGNVKKYRRVCTLNARFD